MDFNGEIKLYLKRQTGFELDVEFQIPAHGITVLFGPSGCGKTTVLRCTAGLERAQGRVIVGDEVWQDDATNTFIPTYDRELGYVFQEASLFEHLDVTQNLHFGLKRTKSQAGKKRLEDAIELLGIGHLLNRRVQELSGGERQRVAIARALSMTPKVLLMDEPLAALDWVRKQDIIPWLERLRDELKVPILYVTHSTEELIRLGDQLVHFKNGTVDTMGVLEEVLPHLQVGDVADGGSVVYKGKLGPKDPSWHTSPVFLHEWTLEVPYAGEAREGDTVRVRIMARDVSIALSRPADLSVRNVVPATIKAMTPLNDTQVVVAMHALGYDLYALVTRRAVSELQLAPGREVFALIKAVAIVV